MAARPPAPPITSSAQPLVTSRRIAPPNSRYAAACIVSVRIAGDVWRGFPQPVELLRDPLTIPRILGRPNPPRYFRLPSGEAMKISYVSLLVLALPVSLVAQQPSATPPA